MNILGPTRTGSRKSDFGIPIVFAAPPLKSWSGSRALRRWRPIFLITLVGTAAVVPIMMWGIPAGADLNNHYRFALPFYEAIQTGNLYPGWLAESNGGYGDTRFRFYPPGLYYLLAVSQALLGWYIGSILIFTGLSILGGLGLYFWTRNLCSTHVALLAGIFYAVAPFRLNELYQASLLSEFAACSILPFALGFLEKVCRTRKASAVAGLAACYAAVILTHLPLAVMGSLSLAVYAAFRIRGKWFSTLLRVLLGMGLGLAASGFFWVTVFLELPWIKGHGVDPNPYYDYYLNFVFSAEALTNRNTWYANLLSLVVLAFFSPGVVILKQIYSNRKWFRLAIAPVMLGVFSLFMTTEFSRPIWAIAPNLPDVQFPWRWLTITSMCGSILLAASVQKWTEIIDNSFRPRHLFFVLAFFLSILFIGHQIVWDTDYIKRQQFDSLMVDIRGSESFKDWLPRQARKVVQMEKMSGKIQAQSRTTSILSWQPEHRLFYIAEGEDTEVRVRTYYYPHWKATQNGQPLETKPAEDGALLITVPGEAGTIDLQFQEPSRTWVILVVSVTAWFIVVMLTYSCWRMRKFKVRDKHKDLPALGFTTASLPKID